MNARNMLAGALGALLLTAMPVQAGDYTFGDLQILHPVARATAPGARVAGGYMTVVNNGTEAERLVGGSADYAGKVEIHEMRMDGDTMIMRPVEGGLEIAPGGSVELKPGGYHIMFMKLGEQFRPGEKRAAKLLFEKAGEVAIEFDVKDMQAMMESMEGHAD